jgi:Tfp pilus assembly protein PilW
MTTRRAGESGLTLTEVTIVAVIGLLVLLGLGGFYLNSQATWLDASSKAITQREATLVSEAITDSIRRCGSATAIPFPDADHGQVALCNWGETTPHWYFWWDSRDSLIHQGANPATGDRGPMHSSRAERFRVVLNDSALVEIALRLRAATGQRVDLSTSSLLRNH